MPRWGDSSVNWKKVLFTYYSSTVSPLLKLTYQSNFCYQSQNGGKVSPCLISSLYTSCRVRFSTTDSASHKQQLANCPLHPFITSTFIKHQEKDSLSTSPHKMTCFKTFCSGHCTQQSKALTFVSIHYMPITLCETFHNLSLDSFIVAR